MVSKRELLAEVWQQPYGGAEKTVDVHLSWLRRKLGETAQEPRFLVTVRGVGVKLVAAGSLTPCVVGSCSPSGAAISLVLLAFLLPLSVFVKEVAANRAESAATLEIQTLVPLVGTVGRSDLKLSIERVNGGGNPPVTVFLPDGTILGAPAKRTESVKLAAKQLRSFSVLTDAGLELVVPVQGLDGGGPEGNRGDPRPGPRTRAQRGRPAGPADPARPGPVLLVLGLAVGSLVARSFVRPVRDLARTADALAAGDLSARVRPAGHRGASAVGEELNRLARRIADLLAAEREVVADLAHRLRTPVTALRLDSEGLLDPEERARLVADADAVSAGVDEVIREARRPVGERAGTYCDAATVVRDRCRFWAVLAQDQGARYGWSWPPHRCSVRCSAADAGDRPRCASSATSSSTPPPAPPFTRESAAAPRRRRATGGAGRRRGAAARRGGQPRGPRAPGRPASASTSCAAPPTPAADRCRSSRRRRVGSASWSRFGAAPDGTVLPGDVATRRRWVPEV